MKPTTIRRLKEFGAAGVMILGTVGTVAYLKAVTSPPVQTAAPQYPNMPAAPQIPAGWPAGLH